MMDPPSEYTSSDKNKGLRRRTDRKRHRIQFTAKCSARGLGRLSGGRSATVGKSRKSEKKLAVQITMLY